MPVKRRAAKSHARGRFPEFCEQQLIQGPDLLLSGAGYFDLVPSRPSCLDQCQPGEADIVLAAMWNDWRRLGPRIMVQGYTDIWALKQFGEPKQ